MLHLGMAIEIELKAWVEEPQALKEVITSLAWVSTSFDKEDAYWYSPESRGSVPISGVRIRNERDTDPQGTITHTTWVTYKTKEVRNCIEVNDEQEFTVSDGKTFEELLKRLGLEQGMRKHKQGWTWVYEGITVELACIEGLGWFVELEILADDDRAATVTAARTRLLGFLHRIGIGEDNIETRYYTEMLGSRGM